MLFVHLRRWAVRALVVGLAFVLSLLGPAQLRVAEAVTFGSVSGTVRDADGNGVFGLRVGIYATGEAFVLTDDSGAYTLPFVPTSSSPYDVQLLAPCTRDQEKRVVVDGAETVNFTVAPSSTQAGYRCQRSSLGFIAPGNPLALSGDDEIAGVRMPFGVPYFGAAPDATFSVSTNGFLSFDDSTDPAPINTSMPQNDSPNGVVAPFWDDLNIDGSSRVTFSSAGTSPNRFFIVAWNNALIVGTDRRVTFEAVLFENGRIVFNYSGIGRSATNYVERGAGATVGIENKAGTAAVQRSFNQPYLNDGFGIEFVPVASK